jgi:hypothetical protein
LYHSPFTSAGPAKPRGLLDPVVTGPSPSKVLQLSHVVRHGRSAILHTPNWRRVHSHRKSPAIASKVALSSALSAVNDAEGEHAAYDTGQLHGPAIVVPSLRYLVIRTYQV